MMEPAAAQQDDHAAPQGPSFPVPPHQPPGYDGILNEPAPLYLPPAPNAEIFPPPYRAYVSPLDQPLEFANPDIQQAIFAQQLPDDIELGSWASDSDGSSSHHHHQHVSGLRQRLRRLRRRTTTRVLDWFLPSGEWTPGAKLALIAVFFFVGLFVWILVFGVKQVLAKIRD